MSSRAAAFEPYPREGLPLEEARRQVLAALTPLAGSERLPLPQALGRVSAAPVLAAEAVPGFRASIMDGYALAVASVPQPGHSWRLVGRSAPGAPYATPLLAGEAIRILTGAPLPEGATRVLPQELVEAEGERLSLMREAGSNPWIRAADEEAAAGQELLGAGVRLGPADLGRLASCGVAELVVRRRPRLGLLITGDELVPAGSRRGPGQIWESNGTLLAALLARLGVEVAEQRVVADAPVQLRAALLELAAGCDLVVSTGGVSAGDSDWIRPLLAELGQVSFWKLFLKPGRPFAFGRLGAGGAGTPLFGLPGNPVAAAITALQLLLPALQLLEGAPVQPLPRLKVRLAAELKRGAGRPELARARLQVGPDGELLALVEGSQASSRIGSLQGADLLLEIPAELGALAAGTELWAQLLRLPIF
ncbi:molybdopterin molybdotransferase MoeA [Synechococcus sp. CS-1324]|uniref:molybdopterin molybdotransferase MoeA n=1 Tax=Synechococcus sp. CS-1324 TaxID=2847980 RepID=UPI000DB3A131|nr:gephyrin-like molybdotransferase Glp [Synechococcus sp. CS-1324]MCT0231215.1 molybdopterin molybdotransferase MoeA [Synechococcus sp. CS-1324]PZV03116.1 MAG: molybdopterin molybdenumtransferase MoeA [Cyanobium sp.]